MIRRPPRSTLTHSFPTRRSSDLATAFGYSSAAYGDNHAGGEYGSAGNDLIDSGVGSDIVAGDALSYSGAQGYSKADNYAHQGGRAVNDTIDTGAGSDLFSGDALTIETDSHDPVLGEYGPEIDSAYAYNEASTQGQAEIGRAHV